MTENTLNLESNLLLCIEIDSDKLDWSEYTTLKKQFCGRVVDVPYDDIAVMDLVETGSKGGMYACGNIGILFELGRDVLEKVSVVEELSWNVIGSDHVRYATLGEVPINVHNVGVYYRDCLGSEYFGELAAISRGVVAFPNGVQKGVTLTTYRRNTSSNL